MKKSKWILRLMLSTLTMLLTAEVLAKGGGTPGSPSGRINEVIVDGARFNPSAKAYMRYRIQMDRMRSTPNMSKVEQRKLKRKIKRELCMDTCKQTLGNYYKWAKALAPSLTSWGAISEVVQTLVQGKTKRELKREGLRRLHDPDPRKFNQGRVMISYSNLIGKFGRASLHVGLVAGVSQATMYSYCKFYRCGKKNI